MRPPLVRRLRILNSWRWLDARPRKLLTQWDFHLPCNSRGQIVSQPLRPGLADVELSADRAHRGNPVRRELPGEQLSRLLPQRVGIMPGHRHAVSGDLGTADDHHEELVGADQRHRGPRGHRRADQAMTQAVRDVGRQGRRDTEAEEPTRQRRNRRLAARRIEHHHRTRVDQTVHRERDHACRPTRLAVRPHEIVSVLVGRDCSHRCDAQHGQRG